MSTTTPAPKPHLSFGEMVQWLGANGISVRRVKNMMSEGIIKKYPMGGSRALYNSAEIERDVLGKLHTQ